MKKNFWPVVPTNASIFFNDSRIECMFIRIVSVLTNYIFIEDFGVDREDDPLFDFVQSD